MTEEIALPPDCFAKTKQDGLVSVNPTSDDTYWKFLDELEGQFRSFISDARAGDLNKTAAARARKTSVVLRKSLKEYREVPVAHDKTYGRKNKICKLVDEIERLS